MSGPTTAAAGAWGNAIEVPGTAALNADGYAAVNSVSCPSAGNCAAGGYYLDASHHTRAFVADEVNGAWGNAIEIPGTAGLSTGGSAAVDSVSCPSAGNCVAGGTYTQASGNAQTFVASEVNGAWGNAIELPGTAALNTGGSAGVASVSCVSAGNCSAGGDYSDHPGKSQAFVVDETPAASQPDLNIALRAKGAFRHGRNAAYKVRVNNEGSAPASHEKVVIHLPAGLTHPTARGAGWTCHAHGRTETCLRHSPPGPGIAATLTLRVHVTAKKGRKLTTTATVTPAGSDTNNTAKNTIRIT